MSEVTAYIGLGSNLDDPQCQITNAIKAIKQIPKTELLKFSSHYSSKPLGPQDQPDFVNAVAQVSTTLAPMTLLNNLLEIETQHGRVRTGRRWGPRTLDLDLLLYGSEQLHEERLTVPHPEMAKRHFVLGPLMEIAPALQIPGLGKVQDLYQAVDDGSLKKLQQHG